MNSGDSDLRRKLGLKPEMLGYTLYAPAGYEASLPFAIPLTTSDQLATNSSWLQVFYSEKATLETEIGILKGHLAKNGQLWICWPKKSSSLASDLSDNLVRQIGLDAGLVDVKVASINDVWSGLKFVYRLSAR